MIVSLADQFATHQLGLDLSNRLIPNSVLLLSGELGSGKTTLVQGIGVGLNIPQAIVSPTFTIVNEYFQGRIPLYHFDLYRLEPQEVSALHLELYWEGIEMIPGIVAIEWSDRLPYLPYSYLQIDLKLESNGTRTAIIQTYNMTLPDQAP